MMKTSGSTPLNLIALYLVGILVSWGMFGAAERG
jgi:hypothetical protein